MLEPLLDLLGFYAVRLVAGVIRRLPRSWLRPISSVLGMLLHAGRLRRKVVRANLERCFPEMPASGRDRIARQCYRWLVFMMLDYLHVLARGSAGVAERCHFTGGDLVTERLKLDRGVILLSGHLGSWELAAAKVVQLGFPFSVLVGEIHNPLLDAEITRMRASWGFQPIPRGMAARGMFKALRQNRAIAILFDQDARKDGVFVHFFGHPASTFGGPAMYALKTGAPVIFVENWYDEQDVLQGRFHEVTWNAGPNGEATAKNAVQAMSDVLEAGVRRHPEQYFWMHQRFKTRPPEAATTPEPADQSTGG